MSLAAKTGAILSESSLAAKRQKCHPNRLKNIMKHPFSDDFQNDSILTSS